MPPAAAVRRRSSRADPSVPAIVALPLLEEPPAQALTRLGEIEAVQDLFLLLGELPHLDRLFSHCKSSSVRASASSGTPRK